jgi:glycosyltransferase involved in cell wall biosynthesis
MMKIALCKTYFAGPVSGADETLVAYAIALREARYDVQVVLLYRCADDDPYYLRLRNAGVPVSFVVSRSLMFKVLRLIRHLLATTFFFIFWMPRSREFLRRIWQSLMRPMTRPRYRACRNFLKIARPDILHVFTPETGAELMIRAGHELGIPVIYHELGTSNHLPMLKHYYRRLEKVLPLCTQFVALSPRLAAEWSVQFPFLNSVSVLPLIMERSKTLDLVSQPAGNPGEIVFGFAARLEEGKGPLVLIDALARVNRDRPIAIARIAGIGPQLLEVKARVRDLKLGDSCEFVGHYSEPLGRTAFMNSLDVLVVPSLAEGTPNSIVEAMAHGVPVIASAVGGIPDMLDADSGIVVPSGDAAALADAMMALAQNPKRRNEMGAAARERYQKLFAPKVVVPLMLKIYQGVAGNGHAAKNIVSDNGHLHPWAKV